jgi:hypothetical protein
MPLGQHPLAECVDARRVDGVQQGVEAELGNQVAADRVAVVLDRRRSAVLLPLYVREPRVARLAERVILLTLVPRVGRLTHRGVEQLA